MEEVSTPSTRSEETFWRLIGTARMDCLRVRYALLTLTATGLITHGYAGDQY